MCHVNNQKWKRSSNVRNRTASGGARGVMVIVAGNGHGDTNSNLGEPDCLSHCTNILGKGMNPIILPPAMGK